MIDRGQGKARIGGGHPDLVAGFQRDAAGEVRAAYNYYDVKSVDGKAHQLSLGYVHNLSKRTALYGTYAFLKNQKSETFSVSANGLGIATPAGGKNQNALTVGIRHAF